MNRDCQFENEEENSSSPVKKKIFKRQAPTSSEIETIPGGPIGPDILRKQEKDQFKRPTDNEKTEIQMSYLVKSENISRRLVLRTPSFEASDPVDDVGDSL